MGFVLQLEALSFAWGEKQKLGGNYSHRRAEKEKHVVLCTSNITEDILNEFMSEFYAYPKLQVHNCTHQIEKLSKSKSENQSLKGIGVEKSKKREE